MIKPRWYFFQEPSPKTEGWNDPAAQHFTGHQVKGLVRESIQNSLDNHAENDGKREEQKIPVIIKFEIFEISLISSFRLLTETLKLFYLPVSDDFLG